MIGRGFNSHRLHLSVILTVVNARNRGALGVRSFKNNGLSITLSDCINMEEHLWFDK